MARDHEERRGRRLAQREAVDEDACAGRLGLDAKTRRARLDLRDGDDGSAGELAALAGFADVGLVGIDGGLSAEQALLGAREIVVADRRVARRDDEPERSRRSAPSAAASCDAFSGRRSSDCAEPGDAEAIIGLRARRSR
jgi:hypothetical protein